MARKASNTVDFPALFGPTRILIDLRRIEKSLSDRKLRNFMAVNIDINAYYHIYSRVNDNSYFIVAICDVAISLRSIAPNLGLARLGVEFDCNQLHPVVLPQVSHFMQVPLTTLMILQSL